MANEYADHSTMRSPLGRVRGLGSSHQGVGHWWLQRVSSALLLPLTLWFAVSAALLAGASHAETVAWIGRPHNTVLLLATLAISFQHTASGLQNILEDYVNQEWLRMGAILAQKTICALLWLASTLAVLRIAI
jgi:succinate dehydrogenase / fumarate reductase membrane anchor subunit